MATLLAAAKPAFALGGKLPELNAPAPDFSLPSNGNIGTRSLQEYRGQWVVLYFYPKDFTSGCTLEARRFQRSRLRAISSRPAANTTGFEPQTARVVECMGE